MTGRSTATDRASASSPAININNRDRHGLHVLEGAPLVGITTKPRAVEKTEMTRQQRDAIKAFGQSVITIEQAFPQEVADTPSSQERSPMQMADAWSTHAVEFLRDLIDSTARSLSRRDGTKPQAAPVAHHSTQQQSVWQRMSIRAGLPPPRGGQATRGRDDSFPDQATP